MLLFNGERDDRDLCDPRKLRPLRVHQGMRGKVHEPVLTQISTGHAFTIGFEIKGAESRARGRKRENGSGLFARS